MNRRSPQKPPSAIHNLFTTAANVVLHSEPARNFARYLYNRTGAGEADAIGYAFHEVLQMHPGVEGVVIVKFTEMHPNAEILSMAAVVHPNRPWTVVAPQHPAQQPSSGPAGFPTIPTGGPDAQGQG